MSSDFLPYGRQLLDADDERAVLDVLRSPYLTTGPTVDRLEKTFSASVDVKRAVVCSNGTAGLHLAALGLGWQPGDAIIVPTLTFLATANCAAYVGAVPVFADVDPATGLMRQDDLAEALNRAKDRNVRAAIPVHLNGQCCDMEALGDLARKHGIALVEDACHAIGGIVTDRERRTVAVGSCRHSDAAVFSMHPVKVATMAEGGIVTTNNESLANRMAEFRNHGMIRDPKRWQSRELAFTDDQPNPWYYEMQVLGLNYRATELQCALGLSQLAKLSRFVRKRSELVSLYDSLIAPLAPVVLPLPKLSGQRPGWHLYPARIHFADASTTRAAVMRRLSAAGIGTQVHYLPVHLQPYYRAQNPRLELPGAWAYYESCLSLPLHAGMAEANVERVVTELKCALGLR